MSTVERLIQEVEDGVELYYDNQELDPRDIPRVVVEDVLYSCNLPIRTINEYWDKLIRVAVERYKTLSEHDI